MRHLRKDYDAIQPWPTRRPHVIRLYGPDAPQGEVTDVTGWEDGSHGDEAEPIIPDEEPVFLLRSQDKFAPALVRLWAKELRLDNAHPDNSAYDEDSGELADLVDAWADEMEEYARRNYNGGKTPDTPPHMLRRG